MPQTIPKTALVADLVLPKKPKPISQIAAMEALSEDQFVEKQGFNHPKKWKMRKTQALRVFHCGKLGGKDFSRSENNENENEGYYPYF